MIQKSVGIPENILIIASVSYAIIRMNVVDMKIMMTMMIKDLKKTGRELYEQ